MRKTITIQGLGELPVNSPRPSIAYDLIATWSGEPSRAHVGRLAAAAIGICCEDRRFPRYDTGQARPISYGGLLMDHLVGRGITPPDILDAGMLLMADMAPLLLQEREVKKKLDITTPPPEELSGSDT